MKHLRVFLLIAGVLVAAFLLWNLFSPDERPAAPLNLTAAEIELQGEILEVDRDANVFTLTQLSETDPQGEEPLTRTDYRITWDEGTQFFTFRDREQVEAGTPNRTTARALRADSSVMVTTREPSGTERAAARVLIVDELLR